MWSPGRLATTAEEASGDLNKESLSNLCDEVFLAPDSVVKPLHQQRVELLQDQTGALHLPGALPCAAVCAVCPAVGLHHTVMLCNQMENSWSKILHPRTAAVVLDVEQHFC